MKNPRGGQGDRGDFWGRLTAYKNKKPETVYVDCLRFFYEQRRKRII